MQVEGQQTVFAVGDCTNTPEEKTALSADLAATCAARNILSLAEGRPASLSFPSSVCFGVPKPPPPQTPSMPFPFPPSSVLSLGALLLLFLPLKAASEATAAVILLPAAALLHTQSVAPC